MMDDHVYSVAQEIADVSINAPHVIILGAGASLAAFPHGDRNGRGLPVMSNFVGVVGLKTTLEKYGIAYSPGDNFEAIYSSLFRTNLPATNELSSIIYDYFSQLELPDQPTLYDHLVLSLREKDFIVFRRTIVIHFSTKHALEIIKPQRCRKLLNFTGMSPWAFAKKIAEWAKMAPAVLFAAKNLLQPICFIQFWRRIITPIRL